jgi:hypothetical protein
MKGTPRSDMAARGRLGALVTNSRYDGLALTQAARDTFRRSFELEVDPEGVLDPVERVRRAEFARRAWYTRMSRRSVAARRKAA